MKRSLSFYVVATVAMSVVATVAVALTARAPDGDDWRAASVFALLGFVAVVLSYHKSTGTTSGSVSFLPFLSGILVTPSVAIPLTVCFAALAGNILQKKAPAKLLFNSAQITIATCAATLVLAPAGRLADIKAIDPQHGLLFAVAGVVFIAVNTLLVVGAIALAENKLYWPTWRKIVAATIVYDVLAFPVIAALAWSYTRNGPWYSLAIVLPLLGLRQLYKQNAQLEKVTEELLQLMVAAMEARDPYTSGHSRRVSAYSRIIARSAKLPSKTVERIGVAALLHDVGKIHEVYAPILRKPGRLTPEELAVIQTHPIKSAELVDKVTQLRDVVPSVRAHHERWDGRGYPDHLVADQIPLGARIIALADTIDAMRTTRPYRGALDADTVRKEVAAGRNSQFDPALVDALLTDASWNRLMQTMRRFEGLRSEDVLSEAELENLEFARPSGSFTPV